MPSYDLAKRVQDLGSNLPLYAEELDPADLIARVFPNQNSAFSQLDVIV